MVGPRERRIGPWRNRDLRIARRRPMRALLSDPELVASVVAKDDWAVTLIGA